MKWKSSRAAVENAANVLPKLFDKYIEEGRAATDGKRSPKELHNFRIKTKAFRYTLELFRPLYGSRLEHDLEPVRELQRVLGKLHDYYVIADKLDADKALQTKLERLTKKKLKAFHKLWAAFDSKSQVNRWKAFLVHGAAKSVVTNRKCKTRKRSTTAA